MEGNNKRRIKTRVKDQESPYVENCSKDINRHRYHCWKYWVSALSTIFFIHFVILRNTWARTHAKVQFPEKKTKHSVKIFLRAYMQFSLLWLRSILKLAQQDINGTTYMAQIYYIYGGTSRVTKTNIIVTI